VGREIAWKKRLELIRVRTPPTVMISSSGLASAGEGANSSEDRVAWNFKVPRAGEISHLEKHQIVSIGGKKRTKFGTTR